jgi:glycine hydroxymethyltransferase
MTDFLFRGSLADVDPDVDELVQIEAERQYRKLILIPSESTAPLSVRQSLGSVFQNIYAEGYPDEDTRFMSEADILDYPARLAHYRRYADPRYYKGVEYADVIESLARRRCAEAFATPEVSADELYVNVQPLSGAPANNAVYHALVNPGDTVLGMNLLHGGHLTHGSPVNRTGKLYNIVHFNVDPETEKIDFDVLAALAEEHKPKMIISGYTSYPWSPDWKQFREIADSVGAYLLADVSHIAGMIVAGTIPSPVGHAHVISFTTHKTLCGPRGACIMTQSRLLGRKIDRAVFPGEQGGPHVHVFAALATTFKIAKTDQFKNLQDQIAKNCSALTNRMMERGLRISYGGSDTHLGNIDCKSIVGPDGTPLSGDIAARILDIAGIVLNRNTIPGDASAFKASGIRYGTPWMTQRGLKETEMVQVADIIADVLQAITPYSISARKGSAIRAKVDFKVLEAAKIKVRDLSEKAGIDIDTASHGYPHNYYLDDIPAAKNGWASYDLRGEKLVSFLSYAFSSNTENLTVGQSQKTSVHTDNGVVDGILTCVETDLYRLSVSADKANLAATWLRDLSDGYTAFDPDISRRILGPIVVAESKADPVSSADGEAISTEKPYFIGIKDGSGSALPKYTWQEVETDEIKRTPINETHAKMGAKLIPFAGWDMPVWYTSVMEEHLACRNAAGLFDACHMGVYQAEGPDAALFLDSVCGNDIAALDVGESCYTHLLDTDANVLDDLLVYRRGKEKYLVVVNASNDDKDWTWLNAVREGKVMVDPARPWARAFGRNVILRNLRFPDAGKEMLLDVPLQGPKSRDILLALGCDAETSKRVRALTRTKLCEATIGGINLVVSRTGYTGERMAFELFVHPDDAVTLWNKLIEVGEPMGLRACGLGARDSLRTEAGLPLYGHEMGGELNLGVSEAGFGSYVKTYKPWFIGREAFIAREKARKQIIVRFRFNDKGVRMAHLGDPVMDRRGKVIGVVSSCAVDSEGFLTGQAFLENKSSAAGTPIFIYQSAASKASKAPSELKAGDRTTLPTPASVVSRFPKPAKKK